MSIMNSILIAAFWVTAYELIHVYSDKNNNVQKDNYGKMKHRLLKLLQKDGYKCEMEEGIILLHYHNENFRIHFSESVFGSQYARVTAVDDYAIDRMDELHPFVMDALMGRSTYRNTRISNLSFDDHCTCFIGTDVKNIKDYYRGLRQILDSLIANENVVRQDFQQYHADFGRKKSAEEKNNHIGFRTQSEETTEKEHQVAAETNITTQ